MSNSEGASETPDSERTLNIETALKYVEKELDTEVAAKSAFELRAFSLVSLNLGVVALYFALRAQLGLWATPISGAPQTLLIESTLMTFGSIVIATIVGLPARVLALTDDDLDEMYAHVTSSNQSDSILEDVLDSRILQLKGRAKTNNRKANLVIVSFVLFGGSAAAFIAAIATSALSLAP